MVVAALLVAVTGGCKGSAGSKPSDGGQDQASDARSDGQTCAADGAGNKSNGEACSCATQCKTGFCVDGVCCDTACSGTCMSCGLATALGVCTAVPAGVKPRADSQCVAQDASSCGLDGTCDGTGQCRRYPSGTVCRSGKCDTDAVTNTFRCDGTGTCKQAASVLCAPFSCDKSTDKCFPTCTSDANCVSGRKCVGGSCGLKMNGATCLAGSECASAHCTDGVCCNTACGGACRSCAITGLEGSCSPTPAGQGHPLCLKQDPTTCGTTGVCDGFSTCTLYPANSPCGASSCSSATATNTARTCDGLGSCRATEVHDCGNYQCSNGTCNTRCTTATMATDCKTGVACMANGTCGTMVDGQPCSLDSDCANQHCVSDTIGGPGICCNTACAGACRSCATGRCTATPAGNADPRNTCRDLTAAMCSTDGKCDGAMACRKYPSGTQCAAETCVTDVYTGPSTCNASGQCIRPAAAPCYPYRCNATKCYGACDSTNVQCAPPNVCGMNGLISQCGLKPDPSPCSADAECLSGHCAQGICCSTACDTACHACNLVGTLGTCSNVASGADPQGICAATAASTCKTTGQCAAGQCAIWAAGTQCLAASCPTASTQIAASSCDGLGTGTCVTPASANCAPGVCTAGACVNTCTVATQTADCTAPATCEANMTCGLQPAGGSCTASSQCASGLACYLTEGSPGVCCNTACSGTCESCRVPGSVGTCTAIAAGAADPDPATACTAVADPTTCGLDGRCAGNNTATNAAGTARCQVFGSTQGCRSRSCTPGTATTAASETAAATCSGAGSCPAAIVTSCGLYNKCDAINTVQCATTCATNADCVGVTCNTVTHQCGDKRSQGQTCSLTTDCNTGLTCADGVCCNSACGGACQACNIGGSVGMCTAVADGTADTLCAPASPPCGHTGLCTSGACANTTVGTNCAAAICSAGNLTPARSCDGNGTCTAATANACTGGFACASATTCLTMCTSNPQCAGSGVTCNLTTHGCGDKLANGALCSVGTDCTSGNCVDGRCCNSGCVGACQACNVTGSEGTCTGVTTGTDVLCNMTTNALPCLNETGACTAGGCQKVGASVTCGAASCASPGAGAIAISTCNGTGMCPPGATTACGNFACNGTICRGTCTMDAHCVNGLTCNTTTGQCTGRPAGVACATTADCAGTLTCVDSVCCMTPTCPAASCTGSMLTPASQCSSGTGTCSTPIAAACAGLLACADASSCKVTCADPTMDCANPAALCADPASCNM